MHRTRDLVELFIFYGNVNVRWKIMISRITSPGKKGNNRLFMLPWRSWICCLQQWNATRIRATHSVPFNPMTGTQTKSSLVFLSSVSTSSGPEDDHPDQKIVLRRELFHSGLVPKIL
mmetsp:Transcript_48366/g.72133  ORF Transcript_48366/g.72133 Transcript_48366/m.72133 type:complete len:117 (-) Transcript_48366:141-491(-)